MYVITNRAVDNSRRGLKKFLSTSGKEGALDLRVVEVTGSKSSPTVKILPDQVAKTEVKRLQRKFNLDIDTNAIHYQSLALACRLFETARKEKKHIVLLVHGYNNDMQDVVAATRDLERLYPKTLFVPFSWPAKGGGAVSGTANYLDDKRDARASSGALDRVIALIRHYHLLLTEGSNKDLWTKAESKHPDNPEAAREHYVALQERLCKVTVNLVCHSMGCYLLKHAALPTQTSIRKLVFDNVCLIAPDANNEDHKEWLDVIESRGTTYVMINEDDHALKWARRKPGEEQKRRLGHYLKRLDSRYGTYLDVTGSKGVGDNHSYHRLARSKTSPKFHKMFERVFTGEFPERFTSQMEYLPDINAYRVK